MNKRIIGVSLIIAGNLVNFLSVYAQQVGRKEEEKDKLWNELFDTVGCMPHGEKVVAAGGLNGHIGQEHVGYEAVHGYYSFGLRNSEWERYVISCVSGDASCLISQKFSS